MLRPAVLVGSGPGCDEVRGRGQLLGRLRAGVEGLLLAADDVASLAPTVVFRDNTYYWRVRALDAAATPALEPRARLREDLRQGSPARRAQHQEPAHARHRTIRARTSTRALPATRRSSDPEVGLGSGRVGLPGRRRPVRERRPADPHCNVGPAPASAGASVRPRLVDAARIRRLASKPFPSGPFRLDEDTPGLVLNTPTACASVPAAVSVSLQRRGLRRLHVYLDDGTGVAFQWRATPPAARARRPATRATCGRRRLRPPGPRER